MIWDVFCVLQPLAHHSHNHPAFCRDGSPPRVPIDLPGAELFGRYGIADLGLQEAYLRHPGWIQMGWYGMIITASRARVFLVIIVISFSTTSNFPYKVTYKVGGLKATTKCFFDGSFWISTELPAAWTRTWAADPTTTATLTCCWFQFGQKLTKSSLCSCGCPANHFVVTPVCTSWPRCLCFTKFFYILCANHFVASPCCVHIILLACA